MHTMICVSLGSGAVAGAGESMAGALGFATALAAGLFLAAAGLRQMEIFSACRLSAGAGSSDCFNASWGQL